MLSTAESHATAVADSLEPHLEADRDVVVIEPSDYAMFQTEYEKFLPNAVHEPLANNSYELFAYVYGLLENGGDPDALAGGDDRIAYHAHCQQRTLGLEEHTVAVLETLGHDVVTSDVECCGMAGSFGYKQEYYDLSMDVGDELATQFTDEDTRDRTVVASGTSCLDQLESLLTRSPAHPVELIAPE